MNKLLKIGLCALAGLLLHAAPASAATFNFVAKGSNSQTPSSAKFHITVENTGGNVYTLKVQGDSTNPNPNTQSIIPGPLSKVKNITFTFYGLDNNGTKTQLSVVNGTGGVNSSAWSPNLNTDSASFHSIAPAGELDPYGSNAFMGHTQVLTPGTYRLTDINVVLQDSGQQYEALFSKIGNVTPEPSALLMVLPGLAPLGIMLRRRRTSSTGAEEELADTL